MGVGEFIKCNACQHNTNCKARTNEECKDVRYAVFGLRGAMHMYNDETLKKEIDFAIERVVMYCAEERYVHRLKFFVNELYRRKVEGDAR